jgi:hypothetical protein
MPTRSKPIAGRWAVSNINLSQLRSDRHRSLIVSLDCTGRLKAGMSNSSPSLSDFAFLLFELFALGGHPSYLFFYFSYIRSNQASITFSISSQWCTSRDGAFEMKDGKTSRVYGLPFCVEFNEKGEGVWTRCRGNEKPAK